MESPVGTPAIARGLRRGIASMQRLYGVSIAARLPQI
jgi:hypothetical protein